MIKQHESELANIDFYDSIKFLLYSIVGSSNKMAMSLEPLAQFGWWFAAKCSPDNEQNNEI